MGPYLFFGFVLLIGTMFVAAGTYLFFTARSCADAWLSAGIVVLGISVLGMMAWAGPSLWAYLMGSAA